MDPDQDVEEWRALVEQEQALRDSIEEIGEPCRSLIEMIYFQTASYEEVSEKLALPLGSLGPMRARCLEKLRARLRRRGVTANF
jgi:DNA-directed RNA polymerase specialized sigma24 family protein